MLTIHTRKLISKIDVYAAKDGHLECLRKRMAVGQKHCEKRTLGVLAVCAQNRMSVAQRHVRERSEKRILGSAYDIQTKTDVHGTVTQYVRLLRTLNHAIIRNGFKSYLIRFS